MKNQQIQVVFLILILLLPFAAASVVSVGNFEVEYEFCEIDSEEEQSEERESEEETETKNIEEFVTGYPAETLNLSVQLFYFGSRQQALSVVCADVVTPPPRFVYFL